MNAKFLSLEAKAACKALHFTPRFFEALNADRPVSACNDEDKVLRIWNSKREIILTAEDLKYANDYLR